MLFLGLGMLCLDLFLFLLYLPFPSSQLLFGLMNKLGVCFSRSNSLPPLPPIQCRFNVLLLCFPGVFPHGSWGNLLVHACNAGDQGSVLGLGRSPGEGIGNPIHCSSLENSRGQRSLAGYSPWGHKESDRTEATYLACMHALRVALALCKTVTLPIIILYFIYLSRSPFKLMRVCIYLSITTNIFSELIDSVQEFICFDRGYKRNEYSLLFLDKISFF